PPPAPPLFPYTTLFGSDLPGSGAVVPAKAVVWGMLVGTIVTLLSSIVPARNAARVPPVAALRDVAIEQPIRKGVRLGIGGGLGQIGKSTRLNSSHRTIS